MNYGINVVLLKPTVTNTGNVVSAQALTVTSTAAVQFTTAFNNSTDGVVFDVQTANVYVTFDNSTPSAGAAHILAQGTQYTWSKSAASKAKFLATTTTNAVLYATEFQT